MFSLEQIKSLAHSNTTAECVFLALAQRERSRAVLNLTLLKVRLGKKNVDEASFWNVFKKLEEMKVGSIVYGRKGNPTTFRWEYDLRDIASAGIGAALPTAEPRHVMAPVKTIKMKPKRIETPKPKPVIEPKYVSIDSLREVLTELVSKLK